MGETNGINCNNESFFKSLRRGVGLVNSSFGFIRAQKLSYVYIFIVALAALWFIGGSVAATTARDSVLDWVQSSLAAIEFLPEWLTTALSYLAGFLTFLLSIILIGLLGGSVVLCALSPVFSVLAEKSFSALTGEKTKNNMKQLLVSIGRGLSVSLYNLFWQLLLLTTLFIASFIPIVGFVTPFLMLMVNAYFFGSSMTDYSMELHKMKLRESLNFASHNKGLMMGIGLPFAMAVCVPWVGTYVALLVSPAVAVAGARAMVLRRSDNLPQG